MLPSLTTWRLSDRKLRIQLQRELLTVSSVCQNKEKERLKEREKEAREREARSSNGHLFTSLTVSSTTLCSSCNRSITAKEALSCPGKHTCTEETLFIPLTCNVAMRSKTPMMKERPSSAIYPSDSLRQSLLGSRRVRSGLSLAKSVSTNNIAGVTEDSAGLKRILSQSTESLNFRSRTLSMESLTDDGLLWSPLLDELQKEGSCVQADSWSLAVEPNFLQTLHKDLIKQQDVIYELIQTEFHHVRTLRIMEGVYRRGMLEEVMLEAGVVHTIFPCLDQLLELHSHFLSELFNRRKAGLVEGSSTNFTVRKLGDLLVRQFSGQTADDWKKVYSEFCSRHPKAVKLYKEVLARDRRLQQFIRRATRGPLLRRHGVQECILLVTQRITKYPVLIQRILDNTKGCEEEAQALSRALGLLKELISSVDKEVLELDRSRRLQEIHARLDPRAQAEVRGGGVFRGGELLRRRLLHEGTLLCKVQGTRMKDVQVLLMSDILVFLQEKDQKFTFVVSLDKSPVVSLTNLIVRDIANQERGMYLISDSTPPEMYELHASSKEDRKTWMSRIQQLPTLTETLTISLTMFSVSVDRLTELLSDASIQKSSITNGNQEISGESPLSSLQDVHQRLISLSTQLHALQAAVIRQDSMLALLVSAGSTPSTTPGSAPGPRLSRSLSRDTGLEASGEAVLLRRQVELLQEEVTRLRLRGEDQNWEGVEPGTRRRSKNGEKSDVMKGEQVSWLRPLAPLATEDPVDQLDGVQEGNEEEEEEVMKISPRSDSPRG
uniref:Rho/rac guanine nucleotide exchange factor (GEF) 2b n=1 Tax=Neolamprologus brichardi TaxID=32507 RepID=A0A3Q4GWY7_NEOBR